MRMKFSPKTVLALLVFFIVLVSIPLAVFQVKQRQEIRKEAWVDDGGVATVSLSPSEGNYGIGETFPVGIYFNTGGEVMSAITLQITYFYRGDEPEVTVSRENIKINTNLPGFDDAYWACPTRRVDFETGIEENAVNIKIGCVNLDPNGYSTPPQGDLLATVNFTVNQIPAINPVVLEFTGEEVSVVYRKSDGQDILGTPISPAGSYMIGGL